jgi:hypothetical protein
LHFVTSSHFLHIVRIRIDIVSQPNPDIWLFIQDGFPKWLWQVLPVTGTESKGTRPFIHLIFSRRWGTSGNKQTKGQSFREQLKRTDGQYFHRKSRRFTVDLTKRRRMTKIKTA